MTEFINYVLASCNANPVTVCVDNKSYVICTEDYFKEQKKIEDAISRQAVLDIAKSSRSNWIDNSVLFKRVNELSPVTPQPKTGHWKYIGNGHNGLFKCDNCGAHRNMFDELEKYCYTCGAKMEREVEE